MLSRKIVRRVVPGFQNDFFRNIDILVKLLFLDFFSLGRFKLGRLGLSACKTL